MFYRLIYLIIHWSGSRLTVEPGGTLENTSSPSVFPTDYLIPLLLLVFGKVRRNGSSVEERTLVPCLEIQVAVFQGDQGMGDRGG